MLFISLIIISWVRPKSGRVLKRDITDIRICRIMGFVEISGKSMIKNAYLPKLSISLKFGCKVLAYGCHQHEYSSLLPWKRFDFSFSNTQPCGKFNSSRSFFPLIEYSWKSWKSFLGPSGSEHCIHGQPEGCHPFDNQANASDLFIGLNELNAIELNAIVNINTSSYLITQSPN